MNDDELIRAYPALSSLPQTERSGLLRRLNRRLQSDSRYCIVLMFSGGFPALTLGALAGASHRWRLVEWLTGITGLGPIAWNGLGLAVAASFVPAIIIFDAVRRTHERAIIERELAARMDQVTRADVSCIEEDRADPGSRV